MVVFLLSSSTELVTPLSSSVGVRGDVRSDDVVVVITATVAVFVLTSWFVVRFSEVVVETSSFCVVRRFS